MGGIEWTDRSDWNPVRGCTRVSEGCVNCYAERLAARFSKPGQWGYGFAEMKGGKPRWTGKVELQEDRLTMPLKWRKSAKIFVNSTSDIFHESLPDTAIDKIFAIMALCPQHTFQVLTKRAERMRIYFVAMEDTCDRDKRIGRLVRALSNDDDICLKIRWPLSNVRLGVSVERQQEADERIPLLLQTPAAVRFISAEPLLGPLTISYSQWARLDWVIVGGESGKNARPMHPDWARSLRDQCAAAGIAFFFKQWGEWGPENWSDRDVRGGWLSPDGTLLKDFLEVSKSNCEKPCLLMYRHGKKCAGRILDGKEHNEFFDTSEAWRRIMGERV